MLVLRNTHQRAANSLSALLIIGEESGPSAAQETRHSFAHTCKWNHLYLTHCESIGKPILGTE